MKPVVAVIAPGNMGAPVGGRLVGHGLKVMTSLAGRSRQSDARAQVAGLVDAGDADIVSADFILSILPPGDAVALAEHLAPLIGAANHKPVYVDCNAISPETAEKIEGVITAAGSPFADCGIIGSPPRPDGYSPTFYTSGAAAPRFAELGAYGLKIRVIDGAAGAASSLKMCYGGITKGLTALGSAVFLAATRAGVDTALRAELAASQPAVFGWLCRQIPNMYSKAYRFLDEMDEVSQFTSEDDGAREIFHGFARLYERLAADETGDRREITMLEDFVRGMKP